MTITDNTAIQALALQAQKLFHKAKRDDGSEFWTYDRDTAPAWLQPLCRDAHGDRLPDDQRYEMIVEAIDTIADAREDADLDAAGYAIDGDVYTKDLTDWLGSRADRYAFCDQAIEEGLWSPAAGTIELLQAGQAIEKREVYDLILSGLRDIAEEQAE